MKSISENHSHLLTGHQIFSGTCISAVIFSYMKSEVTIDKNALGKFFSGITGAPSIDTAKNDSRNRALQDYLPIQ